MLIAFAFAGSGVAEGLDSSDPQLLPGLSGPLPGKNGLIVFDQTAPVGGSRHGGPSGIYVYDPRSGERRRIVKGRGSFRPRFSPDGKMIAFGQRGDIFTISPDGSALRQLTDDPAYEYWPTYLRNGRIAFIAGGVLTTIEPDGTGRHEVGARREGYKVGAVSSNGSEIAFESCRKRVVCRIDLLDVKSGDERRLSKKGGSSYSPSFSPNGSRIAYIRRAGIGKNRGTIRVARTDGSKDRLAGKIEPGVGELYYEQIGFSPDSRFLMVVTYEIIPLHQGTIGSIDIVNRKTKKFHTIGPRGTEKNGNILSADWQSL
ncbi:MAG: PD40 domain-containing protein [Thermoleophilia bacterium]|nr:PD40 domain-containing protein [Thermoleophilia bacterium]